MTIRCFMYARGHVRAAAKISGSYSISGFRRHEVTGIHHKPGHTPRVPPAVTRAVRDHAAPTVAPSSVVSRRGTPRCGRRMLVPSRSAPPGRGPGGCLAAA
eukprot:363012-Chlamydomonas_euryale.AAC.8